MKNAFTTRVCLTALLTIWLSACTHVVVAQLAADAGSDQRNLTFPSPSPSASATTTTTSAFGSGNVTLNNVTSPINHVNGTTTTNATTTLANGTIITTNGTINGTTNGTTNGTVPLPTTSSSSTTSISISTTLAETKGVMGTDVPNPFYTGSTGGNSQNPDDTYVAGATKVKVVMLLSGGPWFLAVLVGLVGGWVLI